MVQSLLLSNVWCIKCVGNKNYCLMELLLNCMIQLETKRLYVVSIVLGVIVPQARKPTERLGPSHSNDPRLARHLVESPLLVRPI